MRKYGVMINAIQINFGRGASFISTLHDMIGIDDCNRKERMPKFLEPI